MHFSHRTPAITAVLIFSIVGSTARAVVGDVSSRDERHNATDRLQDNDTVIIQPGIYQINHGFCLSQPGVTIRGASGKRDDVYL